MNGQVCFSSKATPMIFPKWAKTYEEITKKNKRIECCIVDGVSKLKGALLFGFSKTKMNDWKSILIYLIFNRLIGGYCHNWSNKDIVKDFNTEIQS